MELYTQLVSISRLRTFVGKIAGMLKSLGKACPVSIRPATHGRLRRLLRLPTKTNADQATFCNTLKARCVENPISDIVFAGSFSYVDDDVDRDVSQI